MGKKYFQMREVVELLREEYPDINASTLRFWEKVGLIKPSRITSGGHRRYTEEDLDVVRFIKDMSAYGYSIDDIKKELYTAREKITSGRVEEVRRQSFSTLYGAKLLLRHKRRVALLKKIEAYYELEEDARYLPTFKKKVLERRLEHNNPSSLIQEAEKLKFIESYKEEERHFFSPCDELILNLLIFILQEEKDFLQKSTRFVDTLRYLRHEVGLDARFPVRLAGTLSVEPYKAFLYNLIQEKLSYQEKDKCSKGDEPHEQK